MADKNKTVEFVKTNYRFILAGAILMYVVFAFITDRPHFEKSADQYINAAEKHYDKQHYAEALINYKKAKYYDPNDFRISLNIVKTILQMAPDKDGVYLLRHYLTEAAKTADKIGGLLEVQNYWKSLPVTDKFNKACTAYKKMHLKVRYDIPCWVKVEQINLLQSIIDKQILKNEASCDTYEECLKVATNTIVNPNAKGSKQSKYNKAEQYIVKALNLGETEQKEADGQKIEESENILNAKSQKAAQFYAGIAEIISIQFAKKKANLVCNNVSWRDAVNDAKSRELGKASLNDQLTAYYALKKSNCKDTITGLSEKLIGQMNANNTNENRLQQSNAYLITKLIWTNEQLRDTVDPSNLFNKNKKDNRKLVVNSLSTLKTFQSQYRQIQTLRLKPTQVTTIARVYYLSGFKIKSWHKIAGYDFKPLSKEFQTYSIALNVKSGIPGAKNPSKW